MDPAGTGALIGVSIMAAGMIGCWLRDRYLKQRKRRENIHLLSPLHKQEQPVLVIKTFQKKQTSMRDFFDKNAKSRVGNVVRIS